MSSITLELPEGDAGLSDLSRRALVIYEGRLKAVLEPNRNGKGLAIEPDSGDHEVAARRWTGSAKIAPPKCWSWRATPSSACNCCKAGSCTSR